MRLFNSRSRRYVHFLIFWHESRCEPNKTGSGRGPQNWRKPLFKSNAPGMYCTYVLHMCMLHAVHRQTARHVVDTSSPSYEEIQRESTSWQIVIRTSSELGEIPRSPWTGSCYEQFVQRSRFFHLSDSVSFVNCWSIRVTVCRCVVVRVVRIAEVASIVPSASLLLLDRRRHHEVSV